MRTTGFGRRARPTCGIPPAGCSVAQQLGHAMGAVATAPDTDDPQFGHARYGMGMAPSGLSTRRVTHRHPESGPEGNQAGYAVRGRTQGFRGTDRPNGYEATSDGTSTSRFRILPVGPFGSSSTIHTLRGYL